MKIQPIVSKVIEVKMIEKIEQDGEVLALILRSDYEPEGVNFCTAPSNPLQLGVIKHRQGHKVQPHVHKDTIKTINKVQEILHIVYGKIEAELYETGGKKFRNVMLSAGDTILLLSGGHGFNILEDSKIIEIKQGPYQGIDKDKKFLPTS